MTYAGIGHRDLGGFIELNTQEPVENVMTRFAGKLEDLGYTLNSGGAKGADSAFEQGVKNPAHDRLKGHALDLYARNTNQIFGSSLDKTVDFVVCYTKDGCESHLTRSRESGGTGQAIEMATRKGAPVFNMKKANWFLRLKQFQQQSRIKHR